MKINLLLIVLILGGTISAQNRLYVKPDVTLCGTLYGYGLHASRCTHGAVKENLPGNTLLNIYMLSVPAGNRCLPNGTDGAEICRRQGFVTGSKTPGTDKGISAGAEQLCVKVVRPAQLQVYPVSGVLLFPVTVLPDFC